MHEVLSLCTMFIRYRWNFSCLCLDFKGPIVLPWDLYIIIVIMVSLYLLRLNHMSGFLNLNTVDILGPIIFCCGGCPVHCRYLAASLASIYHMLVALPFPNYNQEVSWCHLRGGLEQHHPALENSFIFLQIFVMSWLIEDSWIFIPASAFSLLFWLKHMLKLQPSTNM